MELCERYKPHELNDNSHSFYDVDNDSLMIGLSNVPGLSDGIEVLKWVFALQDELARADIPVTFGVNLIACGQPIKWVTYPGFVDRSDMLYVPDRIYEKYGRVQRSRLAGDGLIVVSRLLDLAKRIPVHIAFSAFQGGHLYRGVKAIEKDPDLNGRIDLCEVTSEFAQLPAEKKAWLQERRVQAWGIRRRDKLASKRLQATRCPRA